ncbi:hypothetical protein STEG23_009262, partial [Scotinomys teguina]
MEVVAAALRCQLLLIVLMAAMLLPGMKGSPLLVQRTVRTIKLQESIGKVLDMESRASHTLVNCSATELHFRSSESIHVQNLTMQNGNTESGVKPEPLLSVGPQTPPLMVFGTIHVRDTL